MKKNWLIFILDQQILHPKATSIVVKKLMLHWNLNVTSNMKQDYSPKATSIVKQTKYYIVVKYEYN